MPDTVWKVTNVFNQQSNGWSESYYLKSGVLEDAVSRAETIGIARAKLLARDVIFEAYKIAPEVPASGPTFFTTNTLTYTKTDLAGDLSSSGVLINFQAQNKHHNPKVFRGLPDDWMVRTAPGNAKRLSPAGAAAAEAFVTAYLGGVAPCIRVNLSKKEGNIGSKIDRYTAVVDHPERMKVFHAGAMPAIVEGATVQIMGNRRTARRANGRFTVGLVVDASAFEIDVPFGLVFDYDAIDVGAARVRVPVIDYYSIIRASNYRVRSRQTGKPFFVPRGRRANQPQ